MSTIQKRNGELVDLLRTDFLHKLDPAASIGDAISTALAFPVLRALWPMSSIDAVGNSNDVSGQARTLTYNGNPYYSYRGLAPYVNLDGTGDYLSRADEGGLDISGTESYVHSSIRGLTLGAWVWFANTASAQEIIMSKGGGSAPGSSYWFSRTALGKLNFGVSDGVNFPTIGSTQTIPAQTWTFVCGKFTPSTSDDVFVNDAKVSNSTSIPASIQNTTDAFRIGTYTGLSLYMTGRVSMAFLCAAAMSDTQILSFYHRTRSLYGV